jgi:hypothetical protein
MLGRRLEQHDSNQLELKLAYEIDPQLKRQRYGVEAFIFLPRTLGITSSSYSSSRFYEDTIAFARLKTPRVALHALAQPGPADRWFNEIAHPIERILAGERLDPLPLVHRLKLLACIFRSALRDEFAEVKRRFRGVEKLTNGTLDARVAELATMLMRLREEVDIVWRRVREVSGLSEHPHVDDQIEEVSHAVDEFTAINVEELATRVVEILDGTAKFDRSDVLGPVRHAFAEQAVSAYRFRRGRGYPSFVLPDDDNESLPHRRHVLKRIMSSVLYLDIRRAESGVVVTNVTGMVAAGLAMLFAVVVAVFMQPLMASFSVTFIALAVLSYILKDRIKEWGKQRLGSFFSRWLPDKRLEVRDQTTGEVLGECRESVSIQDATKVEALVRELRHIDHQGRAATVIRYHKQVTLSSDALQQRIAGVDGLNDIIRFNLSHLRDRMDEPYEMHTIVDPDTLELHHVKCARVYHVNLVMRFTKGHGKEAKVETERVRVVLDQRGIKRIEAVAVPSSRGAVLVTSSVEGEAFDGV